MKRESLTKFKIAATTVGERDAIGTSKTLVT